MTILCLHASSSRRVINYGSRRLLADISDRKSRSGPDSSGRPSPHSDARSKDTGDDNRRRSSRDIARERIEAGKSLTRRDVYPQYVHKPATAESMAEKGKELLARWRGWPSGRNQEGGPRGPSGKLGRPFLSKKQLELLPPREPRNVPDKIRNLYWKPSDDDRIPGLRDKRSGDRYPPEMEQARRSKRQAVQELKRQGKYEERRKQKKKLEEDKIPVTLPPEVLAKKESIKWTAQTDGMSIEGFRFFAQDADSETRASDAAAEDAPDTSNDIPIGRLVEVRRSGESSIVLVFSSVLESGKPRYLVMRPSGEIWTVTPTDCTFVMPPSLVPKALLQQCFPPEFMRLIAAGQDPTQANAQENGQETESEKAKQQIVTIMRKVQRETEKMAQRMVSGMTHRGKGGGVEALWDSWAPQDGTSAAWISSAEAAEWMLNEAGSETITVRPQTLPAFAAHQLLMRRPDLFVNSSLETSTFLVRSREDRNRLTRIIERIAADPKDSSLQHFADKADQVMKAVREARSENTDGELKLVETQDLTKWTQTDLDFMSVLAQPLYETRSIQITPALAPAATVARQLSNAEGESRGVDFSGAMLDIGVIAPYESITMSEQMEDARRAAAALHDKPPVDAALLKGDELDTLRHDFSSQSVFVIDDVGAQELDDGIAIEPITGSDDVWIHVHVADPSAFVHPNHPAWTTAATRGATGYFPEGGIPLYDEAALVHRFSLGSFSGQGTVVLSARLDKSGHVVDTAVRLGHIAQARAASYDQVNEVFGIKRSAEVSRPLGLPIRQRQASPVRQLNPLDEREKVTLKTLRDILTQRRRARFATSGIEWNPAITSSNLSLLTSVPDKMRNLFDRQALWTKPHIYSGSIALDYTVSDGSAGLLGKDNGSSPVLTSQAMVAEAMVLANWVAARFCTEHNLPVPYRGSSIPSVAAGGQALADIMSQRSEFGTLPTSAIVGKIALVASPVSFTAQPHWLIGYNKPGDGYIRATSPLRRFEDLLVHWQIKSALVANSSLDRSLVRQLSEPEVRLLTTISSASAKGQRQAEARSQAWWRAGLFAAHVGMAPPHFAPLRDPKIDLQNDSLNAVINSLPTYDRKGLAPGSQNQSAWLVDLGVEARLHLEEERDLPVGTKVKVKMSKVQQWPNPIMQVALVSAE